MDVGTGPESTACATTAYLAVTSASSIQFLVQYLTVANPAYRKPSPSRSGIPSSRLSFPSFASIYITISSTSFPSRFDHSPISSRDHERAYFVIEIQMIPHFFFFATNGLLGAIDPIDGGT